MIAYLIKHWKLFLDIVVVVAGIILFTLFDPFGIFTKTQLKGTANLVSSVKEIGELVTAEYYGEVISSLNETYIFDLPKDSVSDQFEDCYHQLLDLCRVAVESNTSFRAFYKCTDMVELRTKFNENQIYPHLIALFGVNQLGDDIDNILKNNNKELKETAEKSVLRRIINDLESIKKKYKKNNESIDRDAELNAFVNATPEYLSNSAAFHYQLNNEGITRRERRHDIVFIGRGWVKAGYKFDQLDERNFAYDSQTKTVRFYGLSPQILDKDINPWFIPEKKIKGFELVDSYKGAQFEDALPVKKKCKEKLLEQAQLAGIINQAQKNGEDALKNLFSLLLDAPDIKVEFYPLPFQNEYNLIAADTTITLSEALLIDSLFQKFAQKIQHETSRTQSKFMEQQLNIFYQQLTQLYFIDTNYQFNIFSINAAKILINKHFITCEDYEIFKTQRDTLRIATDSNKTQTILIPLNHINNAISVDYNKLASNFNQMLACIDEQIQQTYNDLLSTVEITEAHLKQIECKQGFENEFKVDKSTKTVNNQPVYILTRTSAAPHYQFSDLAYPVYTIGNSTFQNQNCVDTTGLYSKIDTIISNQIKNTTNHQMDALRNYEVKSVIVPFETARIQKEQKLKPIKQFIDFVNKPFK